MENLPSHKLNHPYFCGVAMFSHESMDLKCRVNQSSEKDTLCRHKFPMYSIGLSEFHKYQHLFSLFLPCYLQTKYSQIHLNQTPVSGLTDTVLLKAFGK